MILGTFWQAARLDAPLPTRRLRDTSRRRDAPLGVREPPDSPRGSLGGREPRHLAGRTVLQGLDDHWVVGEERCEALQGTHGAQGGAATTAPRYPRGGEGRRAVLHHIGDVLRRPDPEGRLGTPADAESAPNAAVAPE